MEAKTIFDKLLEKSGSAGTSNYTAWRFKLNLLLRSKGLYEIATGVIAKPAETAESCSAWITKDIEAQAIIGLNVEENIALKISTCTSAASMIERLETLYSVKPKSSIDTARMAFFSYKFDNSKTVIDNSLKVDGLAQELRAAGEIIDNEWVMTRILNILPEKYNHFHSAWDSVASTDKTLSNLMERLKLEEMRCKKQEEQTVENALLSKSKVKYKNFDKKSKNKPEAQEFQKNKSGSIGCFKCGLSGHFKKDCRNKPCQAYLDYCKKKYPCNTCQELGHFAKECTKGDHSKKAFMVVSLTTSQVQNFTFDRNVWYQDSGATHHMTGNLNWMTDIRPLDVPAKIKLGDSSILESKCAGNVHLKAFDGSKWYPIVLKQVLFVPNLTFNLFSLTTVLDKGYEQRATAHNSVILENKNIVLMSEREGGLFRMKFKEEMEHGLTAVSIKVWHERLAHQNVNYVREILKKSKINYIDDWNNYVCTGCAYGKQSRISHKTNPHVAERCLDVIHVDLGEMNRPSLGGAKYFLIFKDDYSHFRTVYFLKNKSEAVEKLQIFLNLVENQFERRVKILKSDNGTEIKNARSRDIFEQLGIFHRRSAKYTPQQNGRAEREMRTIVESARAEIYAKELGQQLWAEALNYSIFTINQTGKSSVPEKSPAELWFGRKVSVKNLRQFGCECFVLIPEHARSKLDRKSEKGIFVGYDVEEQGYRIYLPEKRQIEVSCNVLFRENFEFDTEIYLTDKNENSNEEMYDAESCHGNKRQEERNDEESSNDSEDYESTEDMNDEELNEAENVQLNSLNQGRSLRDRRKIKPPSRYNNYHFGFIGEVEDMSVETALKNVEWKRAMKEEMESLQKMNSWILTKLPKNRQALTCKWVFRVKSDSRKKARLVARGYDQKPGIDYYETFSPVARYASIRLILSHANQENFYIETFDIKTAFLNGNLMEEIYMTQPEGFNDGSGKVCKLIKSIYGLKQAPKAWNARITEFLKSLSFEGTDDDPCIFYNKNRTIILAIFVDDGLITGLNKDEVEFTMSKLSSEFETTNEKPKQGKLHYLGMNIEIMKTGLFVNQPDYTKKILEKFGFDDANEASTPMEPGMLTNKFVNDKDLENKPYREAIGSLLYLSTMTRPDISYAVNYLSRHVNEPKVSHWRTVQRVFRYLQGTEKYGIFFSKNAKLQVFTDANYGGDDTDMNSTSGILVDYGGPIVWAAQKQRVTAISSAEAEYRAAVLGIQEICWIRRIMKELKIQDVDEPSKLLIDNKASINMLENADEGKITKGKKHIEVKRKFIQDHVGRTIVPDYIKSKDQLADIFTKPLSKGRFIYLRAKLLKEECWN